MTNTKNPKQKPSQMGDIPMRDVYKAFETDLARDNLENDIPAADLQGL